MYSEIAREEDDKATERYQKDADAALIFVSKSVRFYVAAIARIN